MVPAASVSVTTMPGIGVVVPSTVVVPSRAPRHWLAVADACATVVVPFAKVSVPPPVAAVPAPVMVADTDASGSAYWPATVGQPGWGCIVRHSCGGPLIDVNCTIGAVALRPVNVISKVGFVPEFATVNVDWSTEPTVQKEEEEGEGCCNATKRMERK